MCPAISKRACVFVQIRGMDFVKKLRSALAIVVLSVCLLAGIRMGSADPGRGKLSTYQTFTAQLDNGKPDIYLITKGYADHYWTDLRQGALEAAQELDCNIYIGGIPNEENPELLAYLMTEALRRGADAMIVSPTNVSSVVEAAKQVQEAGIPLVFVDTILNEQVFDVCYETDNVQAGRLVAREMMSLLRKQDRSETEKLSVGIGIGMMESQTMLERLAGFQEYWSSNAPEAWTVLEDIKCNQGDADIAQAQSYEFMQEYRDLAGLVALNNGASVGTVLAVKNSGRKDIAVVGFDYSDEMRTMINDHTYYASSILQRQYNMGYESVKAAGQLMAGEEVPYRYVDMGIFQVNGDNVDSPYVQDELGQ